MKKIEMFKGDFDWLSNFSRHKFRDEDNILWKTVEHYYQAMKTTDGASRGRIWSAISPGQAKRMGQRVELRNGWEQLKFDYMADGITYKFIQNKELIQLLMSTKGYQLIEGNWWHDNFWGDCICPNCENKHGKNWLGKILMLLREGFCNGEYRII